jgi:hypothetical protein
VLAGDEHGVTRLKFTFHRPLDSPDYYFYVASPLRPAYRLDFRRSAHEIEDTHAQLFAEAGSADPQVRRRARAEIAAVARPLAAQMASPIQAALQDPQLTSDNAFAQVEDWWGAAQASALWSRYARWHEAFAPLLRERDRYFRIVDFARRMVRSDLLLTGQRAE